MNQITGNLHTPILVKEILDFFPKNIEGIVVDCTLGEGGHSEIFASYMKEGTLIGLDRDEEILEEAKRNLFGKLPPKIILKKSNFINLSQVLDELNVDKIDFLFYDLGVSMYHFKGAKRGFSFSESDFLDMRLDSDQKLDAYQVINHFPEEVIREILYFYGEESHGKKIAQHIVRARNEKPIETSNQLRELIGKCIGKKGHEKIDPATKSFQAIRIFVNQELSHIEKGLLDSIKKLRVGGRIAVLSFHSLEDRIVKEVFRHYNKSCLCPSENLVCSCDGKRVVKILTKKPISPSNKEINLNPASRSAKLRVVEKVYEPSKKTWELSEKSYHPTKKVFRYTNYINDSFGN